MLWTNSEQEHNRKKTKTVCDFFFFFLNTTWFEVLLETGVNVLNSTYKIQQIIALQSKLMICMQTK